MNSVTYSGAMWTFKGLFFVCYIMGAQSLRQGEILSK